MNSFWIGTGFGFFAAYLLGVSILAVKRWWS